MDRRGASIRQLTGSWRPGAPETAQAPLRSAEVQDGLDAAHAGDSVSVFPGTYEETLQTVRGGSSSLPIRLRAVSGPGSVILSVAGRVLQVDSTYLTVERLVFNSQYGAADTVDVNSGAHFLILRDTEVRRSSRDLIDIASPQGVLIERCLIHHALNAAGGRTDAHGITAGAARDLTIGIPRLHTFSGNRKQIDPGREAPGWDRVTIEGSKQSGSRLPGCRERISCGSGAG